MAVFVYSPFRLVTGSYAECDLNRRNDRLLIEDLSLRLCHLALDNYAVSDHEFFVRRSDGLYKYGLKVADHGIAALMGLFYPTLFGITDADGVAHSTPDSTLLPEDSVLGFDPEPEFQLVSKKSTDEKNEVNVKSGEKHVGGAKGASAQFVAMPSHSDRSNHFPKLIGLDAAITRCIGRCSTETVMKNMYQSILLVGGCAGYPGFGRFLEQRLLAELPGQHRRFVEKERLHVTTRPKDTDSRHVAWRGASVVARLSAAQDAWILQSEWEDVGIRAVREKVPFIW